MTPLYFVKRSLICLYVLGMFLFVVPGGAFAQPQTGVEIPSSFNPVGSGARALGMGGAFIAVADDATAASWNPAGLVQLERPEASVVGAFLSRSEANHFSLAPEASGTEDVDKEAINYLSVTYPFVMAGRNMVVSVNYQNLLDLSRDWSFFLTGPLDNRSVRFSQSGEIGALGAAYAVQISPRLSVGLTLNFWGEPAGFQTWQERLSVHNDALTLSGQSMVVDTVTDERFRFEGFNANIGILWAPTGQLTLGGVVKTPFRADLRHTLSTRHTVHYPGDPERDRVVEEHFIFDDHLDMPLSFGVGIAWRFTDALSVSADLYRTEWQDFILIDEEGSRRSPATGTPEGESTVDPTHQVRTGVEYLVLKPGYVVPLRCGVFYDPAPAEGSPDDFYGLSVGTGYVTDRLAFDIAYQYRFGNDVGRSVLQNFLFSQDIHEHTVYSSLILYF